MSVAVVDVAGERLAALRTACEAVEGVVVLAGSAGCPPAILCQLLLDLVEACRLDVQRILAVCSAAKQDQQHDRQEKRTLLLSLPQAKGKVSAGHPLSLL